MYGDCEMNYEEAVEITKNLSVTSKMPCKSYSLPSAMCHTGAVLKNVEGATCSECYTYKYERYQHVIPLQLKRMKAVCDKRWVKAMVIVLKHEGNSYFRWHDSGDIQGVWHLEKIVSVCKQTPEIHHWLPTLEANMLRRYVKRHGKLSQVTNLCVRMSTPMWDGKPNVNMAKALGVTLSNVTLDSGMFKEHTKEELDPTNFCVSKKQDGHCLECRKCWNTEQQLITYLKH